MEKVNPPRFCTIFVLLILSYQLNIATETEQISTVTSTSTATSKPSLKILTDNKEIIIYDNTTQTGTYKPSTSNYDTEVETVVKRCRKPQPPSSLHLPFVSIHVVLCMCSLVVNVLAVRVHSKKSSATTTLLVALCTTDILQAATHLFVGIYDFIGPEGSAMKYLLYTYRGFLAQLVVRIHIFYLERISQVLNSMLCFDRLLVLSSRLGSESFVQKNIKVLIFSSIGILLALTHLDAYASHLSGFPIPMCQRNSSFSDIRNASHQTTALLKNHHSFLTTTESISKVEETTAFPGLTNNVNEAQARAFAHNQTTSNKESVYFMILMMMPVVNNFLMYSLLLLVIVSNITTHFVLIWRAKQSQWILAKPSERQQSYILIVITTFYCVFALPSTPVSLVMDLTRVQLLNMDRDSINMLYQLLRMGAFCDQMKNASDFFVFLCMSRSFRRTLMDIFYRTSKRRMTTKGSKKEINSTENQTERYTN